MQRRLPREVRKSPQIQILIRSFRHNGRHGIHAACWHTGQEVLKARRYGDDAANRDDAPGLWRSCTGMPRSAKADRRAALPSGNCPDGQAGRRQCAPACPSLFVLHDNEVGGSKPGSRRQRRELDVAVRDAGTIRIVIEVASGRVVDDSVVGILGARGGVLECQTRRFAEGRQCGKHRVVQPDESSAAPKSRTCPHWPRRRVRCRSGRCPSPRRR